MPTQAQLDCLLAYRSAAAAAEHIYPAMAACEAVLESTWGRSNLATRCNNLFGQKQSRSPIFGTVALPTREFLHGEWVQTQAQWVRFPDVQTCFRARWLLLQRLAPNFPHYDHAIHALTAEDYVMAVSLSWSTDPNRARDCIALYHEQRNLLLAPTKLPLEVA